METTPRTDLPTAAAPHRPPLLPVWARALLTPLLFMVSVVGMGILFNLVPGLSFEGEGWRRIGVGTLGAFALLALILAVIAGMMRFVDRRPLRAAGVVWTRDSARLLGLGLLASLVVQALVVGVGVALGTVHHVDVPDGSWPLGVVVMTLFYGLVKAFPLQGIPEELLFRGYLMQVLRRRPTMACWASAGLFALIHLFSSGGQQNLLDHVLYLANPFGFGFLAAALVVRHRSVWPAVGVHAGLHCVATALQFLALDAEGRYYWLASGAVYLLVGLAVLRHHGRREVVIDR